MLLADPELGLQRAQEPFLHQGPSGGLQGALGGGQHHCHQPGIGQQDSTPDLWARPSKLI